MSRTLDYIDARLIAKAIARWRVVGDLPDEELHQDSVACRYLNRRIAELTEEFIPDAIAAIKALGAEPEEREQTAWLIERNDLGEPHWMMLGPRHRFTTYVPDVNQAHRFARKCDAEAFIRHWECSDPVLRATEHRWMRPHGLQKTDAP